LRDRRTTGADPGLELSSNDFRSVTRYYSLARGCRVHDQKIFKGEPQTRWSWGCRTPYFHEPALNCGITLIVPRLGDSYLPISPRIEIPFDSSATITPTTLVAATPARPLVGTGPGYCYSLGLSIVYGAREKLRTVAHHLCYARYIALRDASHDFLSGPDPRSPALPIHTTPLLLRPQRGVQVT
jgi:hypothetical protein